MEAKNNIIIEASIIPAEEYEGMEKIIVRFDDNLPHKHSFTDWIVLKTFYAGEISILPYMLIGKTKEEALLFLERN